MEETHTITRIPINIWDDFWEDGYVPEGEFQETYAYVEDSYIPEDSIKQFLDAVFDYVKEQLKIEKEGVEIEMYYYDSHEKYPNLVGTENAWCLFKRWQINFKHLSHERLDRLIEELNDAKFEIEGVPFYFYSES